MAHIHITTPSGGHVALGDMDDHTAAEIIERLTMGFGKRGGSWVTGPRSSETAGGARRGQHMSWVPCTAEIQVLFDADEVPERLRTLPVHLEPGAMEEARTSPAQR
jgi:hypothetical protein